MHKAFGQDIIAKEIDALNRLHASFPDAFNPVVECLAHITGKVICTGIGKSAHIARKIAATLASTGTPAFFIHATEAMHGDLGMIEQKDAILAFSYSGQTKEIIDMMSYAVALTKIAITSCAHSPMAQRSTYTLRLPHVTEACPLNLAPSSSTTMMLALGDALALTIAHVKDFQKEDFARSHPGGSLGQQLSTMVQIMNKNIPAVHTCNTTDQILLQLINAGKGFVAVKDSDDCIIGLLDATHTKDLMAKKTVTDIMHRALLHVHYHERSGDVIKKMQQNGTNIAFVYDDQKTIIGFWSCAKTHKGA